MKKESGVEYVKRTQKDYSMSFKLGVVHEIEQGELNIGGSLRKYGIQSHGTVLNWLRKYGTFDWENQTPSSMPNSTIRLPFLKLQTSFISLRSRTFSCLPKNLPADHQSPPAPLLLAFRYKLNRLFSG